jgi:alpha-galactosidase
MLARTPPMGWNSWNRFGCNVTEDLIRRQAEALVATGMAQVGYEYVVIDDCWQVARDSAGVIVPDPDRFPRGIANLAAFVHGLGLKFGLYTDAGVSTCQSRPGSFGFEDVDAATYASWGVDYVKVDWCNSEGLEPRERYEAFRAALDATGRPIVLSICNWGIDAPWDWAPEIAQLWRTTYDITDTWSRVLEIVDSSSAHAEAAGPGHWNDPDMLEVGNGGMTEAEYRAHFSLWALMAAPLIAGNDVAAMDEVTRGILTNPEVIAIDQDARGSQGIRVASDGTAEVWARPLAEAGSFAVLLLNRGESAASVTARWRDVGLGDQAAVVRDLWARADRGVFVDEFTAVIPAHDVAMLRVLERPR